MKIAIITDLHWGARGDNQALLQHMGDFYERQFFPYLHAHRIHHVLVGGDVVDRRKFVNYATLKAMREKFLEPLAQFESYTIAGNHDCYHSNTNDVNALYELYHGLACFAHAPKRIQIGGRRILLMPWINEQNAEQAEGALASGGADIVLGHFDIKGFKMYKDQPVSQHGLDASLFEQFPLVLSGHYHHKSSQGNIHYLGAPYQMTWADYDDPRGFHVLDLEDLSLEFIRNEREMFHKIVWDDSNYTTMEDAIGAYYYPYFENSFVKVIPLVKKNPYWFDLFIDKLEAVATDVKVIEDTAVRALDEVIIDAENTIDILRQCVEESDIRGEKAALSDLLVGLYNEAVNQGV